MEQLNGVLEPTGKTFPGIDDLITFSQWSPRLGATVKVDTEGETMLKSHWGRYYGKLISNQFQSISPGNTNLTAFEYNPATRRVRLPFYNINPKANFAIDPDLTQQYTDQFFIGRRAAAAAKLRRRRRRSSMKNEHDFIRLKDVGGTYAAIASRRHVPGPEPEPHHLQPDLAVAAERLRGDQPRRPRSGLQGGGVRGQQALLAVVADDGVVHLAAESDLRPRQHGDAGQTAT